jgi:hypothetical protein
MNYLLVLSFVFISALLLYRYKQKKNKFILCCLYILVIVFCATREIVPDIKNSDAYTYQKLFENARNTSFTEYMLNVGGIEYLFYGLLWLFAKFGVTYSFTRIVYYSLMFIVLIYLVCELKLKYSKFSDLWFIFMNFVLSYCLMRNSLGYIIGWLALAYYFNKKYVKAFTFAIIGTLVHSSCLIVIIYIIFAKGVSVIKRSRLMILLMLSFYAILLYVFPIILNYLGQNSSKIMYYISMGTGSFAILTNILRICILIMMLCLFNSTERFRTDYTYKNIIILCLFALSMIFAQLVNGIAYRFLAYFDILNLIAFNYIRGNYNDGVIKISRFNEDEIVMLILNILVLFNFLNQSLRGYGLIPIYW